MLGQKRTLHFPKESIYFHFGEPLAFSIKFEISNPRSAGLRIPVQTAVRVRAPSETAKEFPWSPWDHWSEGGFSGIKITVFIFSFSCTVMEILQYNAKMGEVKGLSEVILTLFAHPVRQCKWVSGAVQVEGIA